MPLATPNLATSRLLPHPHLSARLTPNGRAVRCPSRDIARILSNTKVSPCLSIKRRPTELVAKNRAAFWSLFAGALLLPAFSLHAAETNNQHHPSLRTTADFAAYAETNYWNASAWYRHRNHTEEDALRFARACFDYADVATNNSERAEIAEQGIAAARSVLARNPRSAQGHYYLGMNYGQLAETKTLGALKLVDEMEQEFLLVLSTDPGFDHAGADRNLGLLYRDAPALGSVGSRTKARQHLQKAVERAPDYPENRLNLIEAYLKWNSRVEAGRELKALEEIWPKASTNLVGDAWAASWYDWKKRLQKIKKKVEEPSRSIQSPRNKD